MAIALLEFGLCSDLYANEFLGAFAAGMTIATMDRELRDDFHEVGERLTELLKLPARPLALLLAFVGSDLDRPEWIAAAWFGPRGFASVFFALLVHRAGIAEGEPIFHLLAMMVATAIIAHSSTDVLVARWFERADPVGPDGGCCSAYPPSQSAALSECCPLID